MPIHFLLDGWRPGWPFVSAVYRIAFSGENDASRALPDKADTGASVPVPEASDFAVLVEVGE